MFHEPAQLMERRKIGCLPAIDNQRLAGNPTEADFVSQFVRNEHPSA